MQKQEDQGPGEGRGLVQVIQDRLCRSQGAYSWLLARGRGPGRRHPGPGPSFLPKAPTSEFPAVSSPLHVAKLGVQAVLPSQGHRTGGHTQSRASAPIGVLQLLQPQLCPRAPTQHPSAAGSYWYPVSYPFLGPLPPPSATKPGHSPTLSASQDFSHQAPFSGCQAAASMGEVRPQSLVPPALQVSLLLSALRGSRCSPPPNSPPPTAAASSPAQPSCLLSMPMIGWAHGL